VHSVLAVQAKGEHCMNSSQYSLKEGQAVS
jgi:hypothetical protein